MKKKILILNGSFCEQPIIIRAKELGYHVTTTGNMPDLIGHQYGDEYIPADYSDKEKILKLVIDNQIEGIISCANDFGVLTAAYVAEKMGWKGHDTYETAKTIHHKDLFKQYCATHNIPSPLSTVFENEADAITYIQTAEYPIIVKATDLTGGKGINKAETIDEALAAIKEAFTKSRQKRIVIEPYIQGEQYSFWGFIANKKIIGTSSNKSFSMHNPYLIQAETYPADRISEFQNKLVSISEQMIKDLNLADGILCLQFLVKNDQIYVIEAMRRCFGNDSLSISERVNGFPWRDGYIRASLGLDCSSLQNEPREEKCCGHYGIMAERNGVVKGYSISPDIKAHLYRILEMTKPGESIKDYLNQRIAYLFYEYKSTDEANTAIHRFKDNIQIELEDN